MKSARVSRRPRRRPFEIALAALLALGTLPALGVMGPAALAAQGKGTTYVNPAPAHFTGKLAEHYVAFSFEYPKTWVLDPTAGTGASTSFVKVDHTSAAHVTIENLSVGYFAFSGPRAALPQVAGQFSRQLASAYPNYKLVSQGETRIGQIDGFEFRFSGHTTSAKAGDLDIWGRCVLVPPTAARKGVSLLMVATSAGKVVKGVDDVGEKGDLKAILQSFKFRP